MWYKNKVAEKSKEIERIILLETSESNIKNLIFALPEGIAVLDKTQKILMNNSAYTSLLQNIDFKDILLIKKCSDFKTKFNENLENFIIDFNKNNKTSSIFGVFKIKNSFLECTGTKVK